MRRRIRWPILLAAAAALVIGSTLTAERSVSTKEGEGAMNMHTETKDTNAALPPIDAKAPKRTETATFALG